MPHNHLYKDYFTIDSFIIFDDKIELSFDENDSFIVDIQRYFNHDLVSWSNTEGSLKLIVREDNTIALDGYRLETRRGHLGIQASNKRGVIYAIQALESLIKKEASSVILPIVFIEDEPGFEFRGIIEGYYGTPWSFSERVEMISFMQKHRLNNYIYAPKTDLYHRERWCDYYPEAIRQELKKLVDLANDHDIDFWYTISPGYIKEGHYAFNFASEDDFSRLYKKIDSMIDLGIRRFGLLLDDIDYRLDASTKDKFPRPGIAHAHICNKLNRYIKKIIPDGQFVMCPTEYHEIGETEYRSDLRVLLDDDIFVFFTGDNVCAEVISTSDLKETKKAYAKDLFIWDNFPVSDFTYGVREFIAPIKNRTVKMPNYARGYFINPSVHYHISKIGMATMADYAWNPSAYHPEMAFQKALDEISPKFREVGKAFIEYNRPNVLSYANRPYHSDWVMNHQDDQIIDYYKEVTKSAEALLNLDLPIIEELSPWLIHAIVEQNIIIQIIQNQIRKEDLLSFLEDIHFSGCELLDGLIKRENLLDESEYKTLIVKRRGPQWYRVFERKQWIK